MDEYTRSATLECSPAVGSVHVGEKHAFSKALKECIRLIETRGVDGDAHAGATDRHLFHIRKFGQTPNLRQVHLIQSETLDEMAAQGCVVEPGELGENISTRNIDLLALPAGTVLRLGAEAVIELSGLRNPCVQIENFRPGLLALLVERKPAGLVRKCGVMSIVRKGGEVRPGDAISIELPPLPHMPLVYVAPTKTPMLVRCMTSSSGSEPFHE